MTEALYWIAAALFIIAGKNCESKCFYVIGLIMMLKATFVAYGK